jgi:hypothetical protein
MSRRGDKPRAGRGPAGPAAVGPPRPGRRRALRAPGTGSESDWPGSLSECPRQSLARTRARRGPARGTQAGSNEGRLRVGAGAGWPRGRIERSTPAPSRLGDAGGQTPSRIAVPGRAPGARLGDCAPTGAHWNTSNLKGAARMRY